VSNFRIKKQITKQITRETELLVLFVFSLCAKLFAIFMDSFTNIVQIDDKNCDIPKSILKNDCHSNFGW